MAPSETLDLGFLPPIYVLDSHIPTAELHDIEDQLVRLNAILTYDVKEAKLFLGNIVTSRRAKLELRWKGVYVEEFQDVSLAEDIDAKRRKLQHGPHDVESVAHPNTSVDDRPDRVDDNGPPSISERQVKERKGHSSQTLELNDDQIVFARLDWLRRCLESNECQAFRPYIVLSGRAKFHKEKGNIGVLKGHDAMNMVKQQALSDVDSKGAEGILTRATKDDHENPKSSYSKRDRIQKAADKDLRDRTFSSSSHQKRSIIGHAQSSYRGPPRLLKQTTSEHELLEEESLPPLPDWVVQKRLYACQRPTPADTPNQDFIDQLKQIRTARLLSSDEIGVRAYSTSIAALAAYPHLIRSPKEIMALPGCDQKIAHLYSEYKASGGHIQAVADIKADAVLQILGEFYEIWGVGAKTARELYYDKGFKDIDDIIEFGWQSLTRVQQIGVKYYDEFLLKIPGSEVESIAGTISTHAKRITDCDLQTIIVGGHRRGKIESGDVDVILSHPKQELTLDLVSLVVRSLEKDGWITHTLTLNLTNSKRGQETLPIRTSTLAGHGFDTLDKALVVWQNPNWPSKSSDLAATPDAKNPNPHRRVDIIISPWKTVGCAVAGWTSGTTFQRDLRRYVKKEKGLKFDSSGVRDRATGKWIDLEGWTNERTRCSDWSDAERRVFEGLGLIYLEPWDRCTG